MWRAGFARACPLRHPVAWVLALRVCSGLTAVFLVVFLALSAVTGKAPGKREATEARSLAVSRRSSRKPGFVVRGGRSRDTRPRTADLGSGGGSMEELAPAAVEFEPRMEPAVRKWCELTPWQRRSMTLDDFADQTGLSKSQFLAAIVRAGFEATHQITDLIIARAFPAAVAAAAKRAEHPDGVLDRQLLFEHMSTALERAAENARRAAGRHDTGGVDSDVLGFLRKDPDASEPRRAR